MAKLTKTSEYVVEFIEKIINDKTTLRNYITWRILSNEKQKELVKISKSSAVTEYFAKMQDSIIICVNEEIFDAMQPSSDDEYDCRELVIEDALANVQIFENDKTGNMSIKIAKPSICITGDGYARYGEKLAHAAEIASMTYQTIQDKKKEQEK